VVVGKAGMATCLGRRVSKSSLRSKSFSSSSKPSSAAQKVTGNFSGETASTHEMSRKCRLNSSVL